MTLQSLIFCRKKINLLKNWQSPIRDEYIEKFLAEHEQRKLKLSATTEAIEAYSHADFVIVAAPTNYDPQKNFLTVQPLRTS